MKYILQCHEIDYQASCYSFSIKNQTFEEEEIGEKSQEDWNKLKQVTNPDRLDYYFCFEFEDFHVI